MSDDTGYTPTPPVLDLEMALLGSIILDPKCRPEFTKASDFIREAHANIFESCVSLGKHVDLVTIKDDLTRKELLEASGGEDYLIQIAEFVPSTANAEHYARQVRDFARRRRLKALGEKLVSVAGDFAGDLDGLIGKLQDRLDSIKADGPNKAEQ